MSPGRQERESRQLQLTRREQILDAAEALFHRKGFQSASMDDIAGALELSKAALYRYFSGKDDIIFTLLNRYMADQAALLENLPDGESTAVVLKQLKDQLVDGFAEDLVMKHLIMNFDQVYTDAYPENLESSREYRRLVRRNLDLLEDLIRRGIGDGSLRAELDSRLTAALIGNGLSLFGNGAAVRRELLREEQGPDPREEFDMLLSAVLAYISA